MRMSVHPRFLRLSMASTAEPPVAGHRIDHDDGRLGDVLRHLVIVLDGLFGLLVTVHADVADAREGHEREQTLDHAKARPQDRDDGELVLCEDLALGRLDGGLDRLWARLEIARHLVAHEHRNLVQELAELRGLRVLVAHDGELVGDQRVVENVHFTHGYLLSRLQTIGAIIVVRQERDAS